LFIISIIDPILIHRFTIAILRNIEISVDVARTRMTSICAFYF